MESLGVSKGIISLKILISAYACSPIRGSEPGVGWGFVRALARNHELWVITELGFRSEIDSFLDKQNGLRNVRFYYLKRDRNRIIEKLWPPSYYTTYRAWHEKAFCLARELHQLVTFDIVHQLTMVGYREPGYLWKLGVPFVWGPVGGIGCLPWRFIFSLGAYGGLYYFFYNCINAYQIRFYRRPYTAAKKAKGGLIAINKENQEGFQKHYRLPCSVCFPVGPPHNRNIEVARRGKDESLRIVWIGLHQPGKALNLGLLALAMLPKQLRWELLVIGDGRERKRWERQALRLGISGRILFTGQLSRQATLDSLRLSHVHLLTSLREGTPTVVVEAFACGVPTVCFDVSGMQDMVDHTCGVKVAVTSPNKTILGMAKAIEKLYSDEQGRVTLALGALERTNEFDWAKKVKVLNQIYVNAKHRSGQP